MLLIWDVAQPEAHFTGGVVVVGSIPAIPTSFINLK